MAQEKYNPNEYFEYGAISAKELVSSQPYQRNVNKRHIKNIMDDFDPFQVNPIKVAYRDGRYYVFDGQHTLSTLICLFGMDVLVPVMIFKKITYEMEAGLFAEQDKHKKKVKSEERLNANFEKKDPMVMKFKKICESYGFECDFIASTKKGKISSYNYLYKNVFIEKGEDRLIRTLRIATKAYGTESYATNSYTLKALTCFLDYYENSTNPPLKESVLIKGLKTITPNAIRDKGKADNTRKGNERFAAQVAVAYNEACGRKADNINIGALS